MNPDTKKFEELTPQEQIEKELHKLQDKLAEDVSMGALVKTQECVLCRPDGTPVPKHWTIFKVGENVVVKDWTFKVVYINESTLILEPVDQIIGKKDLG